MIEMFPGWYPAGDQKQETPKTEHPADGESQADGLPAVNPEALREDGGVVSGRMGNLALEASGVASPENDRSEAASQDSSDPLQGHCRLQKNYEQGWMVFNLIKRRLLLVQKIQTKPALIY